MRESILHIGKYYPPHPGGMETHLRDLAVRQAMSCSVDVVVAHEGMCTIRETVEKVNVVRCASVGKFASMPVCVGMKAEVSRHPADIVHLHTPNPGAAFSFLRSGHRGKLVITHHADTMGRKVLRKVSDPFVYRVMDRADRIIVTSARYLESSSELASFHEKCRVVPLGIEIKSSNGTDHAMLTRLKLQFGDRFVIAVGRLVPYKGFDVLIRAMKTVNARLLLIGTGPERKSLSNLAVTEGITEKIVMLGSVDDLRPYLAAASVFVLPSVSRAEAFGIVQMEAMAASLPVINTEIDSGVPEVSIHGKTGITVPPKDATALSAAIRLLLQRDELRYRLGEAARARVLAEYSADLMAARTLSVYSEVLGR